MNNLEMGRISPQSNEKNELEGYAKQMDWAKTEQIYSTESTEPSVDDDSDMDSYFKQEDYLHVSEEESKTPSN